MHHFILGVFCTILIFKYKYFLKKLKFWWSFEFLFYFGLIDDCGPIEVDAETERYLRGEDV